jgi:hypothetical protein
MKPFVPFPAATAGVAAMKPFAPFHCAATAGASLVIPAKAGIHFDFALGANRSSTPGSGYRRDEGTPP